VPFADRRCVQACTCRTRRCQALARTRQAAVARARSRQVERWLAARGRGAV